MSRTGGSEVSRKSKKMTAQQLTDVFLSHEKLIEMTNTRIDHMAHAVISDFERMNALVMAMIEHLGYIKEKECQQEGCEGEFAWPDIGGLIPEPTLCPVCHLNADGSPPDEEE